MTKKLGAILPRLLLTLAIYLTTSILFSWAQKSPTDSLVFEEKSLIEVLSIIQQIDSIKFSYVENVVANKTVTTTIHHNYLYEGIEEMMNELDIGIKEVKPGQFILFEPPQKNSFNISGLIKSSNSALPVPFATLFIRNSNINTLANENGNFDLANVQPGINTIEISSLGYEPIVLKINVTGDQSIQVVMQETLIQLQTVEISPDAFEYSSVPRVSIELNKEELLSPPNIARDLIRNMKLLPGISNDDISARTRIRGGDWDETAIFFDHLEIYEPFHLEEVDGLASLFDIELIRNTKILTGGFASRYTNKMSGIIEVSTADYVSENSSAFSIDLLGVRINTHQRVNNKLDIIGSIRRGYLDLFVRSSENGIRPKYFDSYLRINQRLDQKNQLSYHFLLSSDDLEFSTDLAISRPEFFESQRRNFYVWVNWKRISHSKFSTHTTFGFQQLEKDSRFQFESSLSSNNQDDRRSGILTVNNRNYLVSSENNDVEFGVEFKLFNSDYLFLESRVDQLRSSLDTVFTNAVNIDSKFSGYTLGFYAQDTWEISNKMRLNAGVRLSGESYTDQISFAPRLAVSYKLSPKLISKFSYGLYYQPENFQKLRVYEGKSSLTARVMKSIHYIGALQFKNNAIDLLITGYYKDYPVLFDDYRFDFYNRATLVNILDYQDFETISGQSSGVEFFLRHNLNWGFLGVNYTYAISKISNSSGIETYRDYDRRHSINISNVVNLGKNFTISANWSYHSGNPFTESTFIEISNNTPSELAYFRLEEKNAARLPSYHSLDLKFEKAWKGKTTKTAYLNVINTYNRANIRNFHWNGDFNNTGQAEIKRTSVGLPLFFISPGFQLQF